MRPETNNDRTIVIFALRYALPRHTYAAKMVTEFIKANIDRFEPWEIEGMIDDCRIYYPSKDFGGDTCDRPLVDAFAAFLSNESMKREREYIV